jgi:DNA-binding NtrC family response regulator
MKNINVLYWDEDAGRLKEFCLDLNPHCNAHGAGTLEEVKTILNKENIHLIVIDQKTVVKQDPIPLESLFQISNSQMIFLRGNHPDFVDTASNVLSNNIVRSIKDSCDQTTLSNIIEKAYESYVLKKTQNNLKNELVKIEEELSVLRTPISG